MRLILIWLSLQFVAAALPAAEKVFDLSSTRKVRFRPVGEWPSPEAAGRPSGR